MTPDGPKYPNRPASCSLLVIGRAAVCLFVAIVFKFCIVSRAVGCGVQPLQSRRTQFWICQLFLEGRRQVSLSRSVCTPASECLPAPVGFGLLPFKGGGFISPMVSQQQTQKFLELCDMSYIWWLTISGVGYLIVPSRS